MEALNIGILGTAGIAEAAIIQPAILTGNRIAAVAARDPHRAREYAEKHGIPRTHDTYEQLISDPGIDAIYNPLPNNLHGPWNRAAAEAGKHILTEKPSAANANDAMKTAKVVAATGVQFLEGFHYSYHPIIDRLHAVVASGEIGNVERVESVLRTPAPEPGNLRWSLELAGGALMDLGCYALHSLRLLAPLLGGEPVLRRAEGAERAGKPGVDEWVTAELEYPTGAVGIASCNMAAEEVTITHRVVGEFGEACVPMFLFPQADDRLVITTRTDSRTELLGRKATYTYQLEAFASAVRTGRPARTDPIDALATMRLIDDCYRAIGLDPRSSNR